MDGLRCRHAFEALTVHANGDVVCSIIDGRGDFVLGNVHRESIAEILHGPRLRELRRLVLSRRDDFCPAVGRRCPLKNIQASVEAPEALRYLMIEPTSACDLRCLTCPVRDFAGDVGWRDAFRDGGMGFAVWDGARRLKQHAADALTRVVPQVRSTAGSNRTTIGALATRGRVVRAARTGTLPVETLNRVVTEAGPAVERIDLFNYGEPFLYRHLITALQHIRTTLPATEITVSTDGMQVQPHVEAAIVDDRLLDWVIFSVDGCDDESYRRYRIRGRFEVAWANMVRFHRRAARTGIRVIWQYVVFRWNDRDEQFERAIRMAEQIGITIWFDFAHTWGRSRRRARELQYLKPYLRPFTALPGERREGGW